MARQTIAPVAKIVGPGNAYVAAAKRRVFGVVGIDLIAGPSEVVILADRSADPRLVAADLLAQAEHDEAAQSILITDDADSARRGRGGGRPPARDAAARADRRRKLARQRRDHPLPIARGRPAARRPARAGAPGDHRPRRRGDSASKSRTPARSSSGAHTPEAIGDYVGGSNHVLPTARSARFSSGLGVLDFMKRTSLLKCDARALAVLGPAAVALGEAEALDAHARSVAMRLEGGAGA